MARINYLRWFSDHFWDEETAREWISSVPCRASTDGIVVNCRTPGIIPTGTNTMISTLLLDTGLVTRTFHIEDTFWATVWRTANIPCNTGTSFMSIDFSAEGIRSTR